MQAIIPLQVLESPTGTLPYFQEGELEQLTLVMKKVAHLSKEKLSLSHIALPVAKQWIKEIKHQSYLKTVLKIGALPLFATLVGLGGITSYSSISLLVNSDFSSTYSSNIADRVYFANNITNSGALFACITDFPAITYIFLQFVFKKAYRECVHKALDLSYHSFVDEEMALSASMHEALYQKHLVKLSSHSLDQFYRNPDPLSTTGKLFKELTPLLKSIDQELGEGISLKRFGKMGSETFNKIHPF